MINGWNVLGCGTVYAKYEVKQEPSITTLIDPDTDPFDRDKNIIESVRERRKFDSTGKRYSIELYRQKFDQIAHLGLCKVDTGNFLLVNFSYSIIIYLSNICFNRCNKICIQNIDILCVCPIEFAQYWENIFDASTQER